MTTIGAWNLHHMASEARIPKGVLEVIGAVSPDVLVLTEYVHGSTRDEFIGGLLDLGYETPSMSECGTGGNQVLIACRQPSIAGHIQPPTLTTAARTNFLHRRLTELSLDVIGLRAPYYKTAKERDDYWVQLEDCMTAARPLNAVFIGDLNWPRSDQSTGRGLSMRRVMSQGFTVPEPEGTWSFMSTNGRSWSLIDHAVLSPTVKCTSSRFIYREAGHALAGPAVERPLSDHAMLWVEVELISQ
jgi:hypothetical protein